MSDVDATSADVVAADPADMVGPGSANMLGPSPADIVAAARAELGEGRRAWVVGGAVRDDLLGRPVGDLDLVVDGPAEAFARRLAGRLGAAVFAPSERFASFRILAGGRHVDVAPLRGESLDADLAARDATVNAMAREIVPDPGRWGGGAALVAGPLRDPLGGHADLACGRLRLCRDTALADDPLRVLRLARLTAALGLEPDRTALSAARRTASALSGVPGERLRDELSALLAAASPVPARALRRLAALGALAVVLPEVDGLRGVGQNPYHHHDVFEHTLEALDYIPGVVAQLGGVEFLRGADEAGLPFAPSLVPLAWAVLLHDVGKPEVRKEDENGRILFWQHDQVGQRMVAEAGARLRFSRRFVDYLGVLVRHHLRLGFLVREQPLTRRALARYRRDVTPYVFESVAVSLCDRLATRGEKTSRVSIARHYRLARLVWSQVTKAPVPHIMSGRDVMDVLGIGPGPAVGRALEALDEEVEAGEVRDLDAARAFLFSWWEKERASSDEGAPGGG
ncbi:MAG TPA: HD domain-containing protein [Thermoleophilia bacterium]|nr:HD domain-containing protein [Thermoleophilia bacterium]HQG03714.1 HD domain-containing protein [Thermoleophilia bacterium]HQG55304.1 HD domain-containing protein [Thermoleophilia bacterium]HQJ98603.1 HD domain-containing protein [Thermoleophilia bacterium]